MSNNAFHLATSTSPAITYTAVVPSDTVDILGGFRSLYIGAAGNLVLISFDDVPTPITFVGLLAGTILPVIGKRVNATGTTAGSIVALK